MLQSTLLPLSEVVAPTHRKCVPQSTRYSDQIPPAAVAHRVQGEALYRVVLESMLSLIAWFRLGRTTRSQVGKCAGRPCCSTVGACGVKQNAMRR